MTREELDRLLDRLAAKRDQAADKMGNPLLAWTYQSQIDDLLAKHGAVLESSPAKGGN